MVTHTFLITYTVLSAKYPCKATFNYTTDNSGKLLAQEIAHIAVPEHMQSSNIPANEPFVIDMVFDCGLDEDT